MKAALNISSTDALNISASVFNQEKAHKMGLDYLSHVYEEINTKVATGTYLTKDDNIFLLKEKIIFWNNKLQELTTGRRDTDKNILEIMINIEEIIDSSNPNDIYFHKDRKFNTVKNIIKNYIQKLEDASLDALYDVCLNQYKLKLTCSKRFLYLENEEIIEGNRTYTSLISMFKAKEDSINRNIRCPLHTISMQRSMPIPMPGINADHIEQRSMNMISKLACRLEEDEAMIAGYGTPPAEGSGRLYAKHILTNIFNLLKDLSRNKQDSSD